MLFPSAKFKPKSREWNNYALDVCRAFSIFGFIYGYCCDGGCGCGCAAAAVLLLLPLLLQLVLLGVFYSCCCEIIRENVRACQDVLLLLFLLVLRRKNARTRTHPACCIADLTIAGVEVVPHYHQSLCCGIVMVFFLGRLSNLNIEAAVH